MPRSASSFRSATAKAVRKPPISTSARRTLKVGNGVDAFLGEQFDAVRHPAGQDSYRPAGIDSNDIRRRKVEAQIRLTGPYRVRGLSGRPRIASRRRRGDAESRCSSEAQSRCFKRPFRRPALAARERGSPLEARFRPMPRRGTEAQQPMELSLPYFLFFPIPKASRSFNDPLKVTISYVRRTGSSLTPSAKSQNK